MADSTENDATRSENDVSSTRPSQSSDGADKLEDKKSLTFPPILLASYTLPMCTYASYMYSLARVTVFNFQPGIRIAPWATLAAFGAPTALSLIWRFITLASREEMHTRDYFLQLDYSVGLRLILPATVASVFTFAKRGIMEFLLNSWRPTANATTVGPGIIVPINALAASYLSEFMFPLFQIYSKGTSVSLFIKPLLVLNTCLLDVALTNAFAHLPPYYALASSASLIAGFFGMYFITNRHHAKFSDLTYERWIHNTDHLTMRQFWELCRWALYLDFCF